MTILTEEYRNDFTGDGATVLFNITIEYDYPIQLRVILVEGDGTEVLQVLNSNYTISNGTLGMLLAPAVDEKLIVLRDMPFKQQSDYIEKDLFPVESHEENFDLLTMTFQQVKESQDRTQKASPGNQSLNIESSDSEEIVRYDGAGGLEASGYTKEQLAFINTQNGWTAAQRFEEVDLNSTGSGTFIQDALSEQFARLTLTENVTISDLSNRNDGGFAVLVIVQGPAVYTITWDFTIDWGQELPSGAPKDDGDVVIIQFYFSEGVTYATEFIRSEAE